ncbi:hypothetical protein, partial [uncultured Polaribacter sp.]|uniref:hypothetical protein n=1 Tax=uncultured Polaribacter sp. TaxID=174711 RepID=UPI00260ED641
TSSATDFVGTTDAQALVLKSNNVEKLKLHDTKNQVLINQATTYNDHSLVIKANGNEVMALQDATGVSKWNWDLDGDNLNFEESDVADYRLFLEAGGKIGINTNTPEAMLDINTEETPGADIVPLRIVPNTVTPTG